MANKEKVNAAFDFVHEDKPEKEPKTSPVSVQLEPGEIAELKQYAAELGVTQHKVLQYAVRSFLARYRRGEKPRMVEKKVKDLAID